MIYLAILVSLFLILSLWYFGKMRPEYSHIKHTISELAESKSVTEKIVSYGVFLPIGISMALISVFVYLNEPALLFSTSLALGYFAAALFPIDQGAPFFGTWKNVAHNIFGGISYVLAFGGFERLSQDVGFPYNFGKFLIVAFIASLYIPAIRNFRGLLQRATEIATFLALIICLYKVNA